MTETAAERRERVRQALEEVGVDPAIADRHAGDIAAAQADRDLVRSFVTTLFGRDTDPTAAEDAETTDRDGRVGWLARLRRSGDPDTGNAAIRALFGDKETP